MSVEGAISVGMLDNDRRTITTAFPGKYNPSIADRANRGANRHGYIDAAVKNKFAAAKRINPQTNTGGYDSVFNRQFTVSQDRDRQG